MFNTFFFAIMMCVYAAVTLKEMFVFNFPWLKCDGLYFRSGLCLSEILRIVSD